MIATDDFLRAYRPSVTAGILRSRGANPDLADEIAQEVWARAWEHRMEIRHVRMWVMRASINLLVTVKRRLGTVGHAAPASGTWRYEHAGYSPLAASDSRIDALRLLSRMSARDRSVLADRFARGIGGRRLLVFRAMRRVRKHV